jgi:predicted dienelactone hydrolase
MFERVVLVTFIAAFGIAPVRAQQKLAYAVHAFAPSSAGQTSPEASSEEQESSGAPYVEIAGRQVAMWKPAGPPPAEGYPIIVFSHGFTLCEANSKFLTEGLAQAGYFVLAPHHQDGSCGGKHGGKLIGKLAKLSKGPEEPFRNADGWNDATYTDRRDDLEAVLDAVLKNKSFQGVPIDASRVGLAGHSLGGYTALALAGAWPSWKDPRIKAVLAMSPFCTPFFKKGDLGHLDVPVMYQGGTGDFAVTPTVARPGGGYDLTSPPKYFVEFAMAGHLAFTDAIPTHHDLMERFALAFFDRYLKRLTDPDPLAALVRSPRPSSVSRLEYAEK